MIPFSVNRHVYAFCGPYPDAEAVSKPVNDIFPLHVTCGPRIFETTPYNFGYFKTLKNCFDLPPTQPIKTLFLGWIESKKEYGEFWRRYGIFPLIQFARTGPKYRP
jgi:hypothetical protein